MHLLNFRVFAANPTIAFGNRIGDAVYKVKGLNDMYVQAMILLTWTCTWGKNWNRTMVNNLP